MKGTWHLCSSHEAEVQQYVANQSATGAQNRQQRRPSALPALYSTALLNLVKSWSRRLRLGLRYIVGKDERRLTKNRTVSAGPILIPSHAQRLALKNSANVCRRGNRSISARYGCWGEIISKTGWMGPEFAVQRLPQFPKARGSRNLPRSLLYLSRTLLAESGNTCPS